MKKPYIKITICNQTEQFEEPERSSLIEKYQHAVAETDGADRNIYAYIASSLSLGATEIDADKFTAVFPKGSEGAALDAQFQNDIKDFGI